MALQRIQLEIPMMGIKTETVDEKKNQKISEIL